MIYTGGQKLLTRETLRKIPVPERTNVGANWAGVNHGELADAIVNYVQNVGFKIARETWYCNPNQSALYGSVDINTDNSKEFGLDLGQAAELSLGVRHDNAGRYAVSIAVGARVVVCSNGLFSGDFVLKHKHNSNLSVEKMAEDAVEEWMTETDEISRFCNLMRGVELDDRDAAYIMMNAAEGASKYSCIPWKYIRSVHDHWKNSRHKEFEDRNMWSLYNAFTETAKQLSPPWQMVTLKGLRPMMDTFAEKASLN